MAQKGTAMRQSLPVDHMIEQRLAQMDSADGPAGSGLLAFYFDWDRHRPWAPDGHVHPGFELSMVLSGAIHLRFAEEDFSCQQGEVWLSGLWEPHEWQIERPGTTSISLLFSPRLLAALAEDGPLHLELFAEPLRHHRRPAEVGQRDLLLAFGHDVRREILRQAPFWESMLRLDLLRILGELARSDGPSELPAGRRARQHRVTGLDRIVPALRLVQQSPTRRITAEEAARACALSRSQFNRIFRSTIGLGYAGYSMRVRLAAAARDLLHTDNTLDVIAGDHGFADVSHLIKAFSRQYRCTPGAYRERRWSGMQDGAAAASPGAAQA